jgi:MYND finger
VLQIPAVLILPKEVLRAFWGSFVANNIITLSSTLRNLSYETQPQAIATLVQILSLLPDPKENAYFRKFLRSPHSAGLPNLIAQHFIRGVAWKRPSGPGFICKLLIHFIVWCDPSQGDDHKACIDVDPRTRLTQKVILLMSRPQFHSLDDQQKLDIQRLDEFLLSIEGMPEDTFVRGARDHLQRYLDQCDEPDCSQTAELWCSRCKGVRYCGRDCQTRHWSREHKLWCFTTTGY